MIKVINNFLPELLFRRIKGIVTASQFKWCRYENIVGTGVKQHPYKSLDGFSTAIDIRDIKETGVFLPLLDYVTNELNITPHSGIRMFINLTTPQYGWTEKDIAYPHIDTDEPHTVALFYIDDADGNTILFDNYGPSTDQEFKIKEIIKPEPNKLLLFDGMQFHAGNPPLTSRKRIVINMNFRKA